MDTVITKDAQFRSGSCTVMVVDALGNQYILCHTNKSLPTVLQVIPMIKNLTPWCKVSDLQHFTTPLVGMEEQKPAPTLNLRCQPLKEMLHPINSPCKESAYGPRGAMADTLECVKQHSYLIKYERRNVKQRRWNV